MCYLFLIGTLSLVINVCGTLQSTYDKQEKFINKRQAQGNCGPLRQLISEEETCYVNDAVSQCPNSASTGTVFIKRCKEFYTKDDLKNTTYKCENGVWTRVGRFCQPECGKKIAMATPLIIGGENATEHEYPWVALLYDMSVKQFICAGSIISPYHILTAAHCLSTSSANVRDANNFTIAVGKYYSDLEVKEENEQIRTIKSIHIDEYYSGRYQQYSYDIAILELNEPIVFSTVISPICIDWNSTYEETDLQDGNTGEVIGWGFTKRDGPSSSVLKKLIVPYVNISTCIKDLPEEFALRYVTEDHICAGYLDKGMAICQGDTGGGLCFKSSEQRYFLRGIPSLGVSYKGGCNENLYSIYTRVSRYIASIRKVLESNPNFEMDFITEGKHYDWIDNGCLLPEHVKYGRFVVSNSDSPYIPSSLVPASTIVFSSCSEAPQDETPTVFMCKNKKWEPNFEKAKCKKPGTCPSLKSSTSEEVICKHYGYQISCEEPQNNATAVVRCQPFYIFKGNRPIYKCINGKWDQLFISCNPECGRKRVGAAELIIGGSDAVENEYPWVVAIYNSQNEQNCGGTIISRYYVLSAAHCFTNAKGEPRDKNDYTVVAGKHYRNMSKEESASQTRKIEALYIHEDYKDRLHNYRDDIALIKVRGKFTLSLVVEPVCLDWDSLYEDFDFEDGREGVVTGWGNTDQLGPPSDTLKKVVVPFRSKKTCLKNLPLQYGEEFFSSDKICAGYKGNDTNICQGDSGGGLYFKSDRSHFYIRGIASITARSRVGCDSNNYALYTKVSQYLSWIETITRRII